MAVLTKATAKDDSGEMEFEQGKAAYRREGKELEISSRLSSGHSYSFTLSFLRRMRIKLRKTKKATDKKESGFGQSW